MTYIKHDIFYKQLGVKNVWLIAKQLAAVSNEEQLVKSGWWGQWKSNIFIP